MDTDLITKVTQVIPRQDGSELKIVVEQMTGLGLHGSLWIYVHRRETIDHPWILLSDKPHPNWRSMSVNDYIEHGRSEIFQSVSPGEILKLIHMIGKPMTSLQVTV
ncbi:hypothetical protein GO003_024960 [Methylicorpusculum oleiharenae]|uniref:hypothetical protein n=1 Tax=Methylicorpusculum oleiharenae TaxID=1338687 RepID=UPI0013597560|nr:hypothetical protein [Methylicorpusculum oleiharenae]MCD2453633.1 hypothetical protein [Methylicorpusculum oleiharenae]